MREVNPNKRWVRVQRTTEEGFVEFEFFVADKDLYVDLVLPVAAFNEFCSSNAVCFLDPGTEPSADDGAGALLTRIK
jgi:phenol hydroxylase P0 protein